MTQKVLSLRSNEIVTFELPNPKEELMPGLRWGRHDEYYSAAYWAAQTRLYGEGYAFRLGESLVEEVAACLLGGHGIPAEVGIAAFKQLRDRNMLSGEPVSESNLFEELSRPLQTGNRTFRYRFARQKASYLAPVLVALRRHQPETDDHLGFRAYFLQFRGFGLKTASWITRNWLNSQEVAIIDVHVHRAGLICGLFSKSNSVLRDYLEMERRFLRFARALGVEPSRLDAVIWAQMKEAGSTIFKLLP
jgi:N-glycosylase/DNA lyase